MKNNNTTFQIPDKSAGKFSLPVLGIGTYQMGGTDRKNTDNDDERDIRAIQNALTMGITHIDTAESYADGYAEILVARAIKKLDRNKLFITTKVRKSHLHYDDIIQSAKNSIKRLGIEAIDLYLIHAPSNVVPIQESMRAMCYLIENQLIRYIGVSNFNSQLIEEAQSYAKYPIVNNQIHYNLSARAYEEDGTLEFCRKNTILVTAYRIIGYDQYAAEGLAILKKLSEKYKKTPAQIALSWVLQKPNIIALIKSSNPDHLKENLGSIHCQIDKNDMEYLDTNFPKGLTMNTP